MTDNNFTCIETHNSYFKMHTIFDSLSYTNRQLTMNTWVYNTTHNDINNHNLYE